MNANNKESSNDERQLIKFRIVNVKAFITVINIVKEFSDVVNLVLTQDGLEIVATDSAHVVLFKLCLTHGHCIVFQTRKPSRTMHIGVNLKILSNGLKGCTERHDLYLIIDQNDCSLTLHMRKEARETFYKVAQFLIVDHDVYEIDPTVVYEAEVLLPTQDITDAISDCKSGGSDRIDISLVRKEIVNGRRQRSEMSYLKFKCSSQIVSSTSKFPESPSVLIHWRTKQGEKQKIWNGFSLRVLATITKTCKISENVLIELGKNVPLSFSYMLEGNMGTFRFYVAPYVDSIEDEESEEDIESSSS